MSITAGILDRLGGRLKETDAVAVAVSGGADSMALCLLAQEWAKHHNKRIVAVTLDHRLRLESAKEAQRVRRWLLARGIEHHILVWDHPPLSAGIEAQAREARYRLLTLFCHAQGLRHLLVGHHLQDQAETFLLRLRSGFGPDGLACMSPVSERDGIVLLRPLLHLPKHALTDYLKECGQEWLEDPTNADLSHDRNALRALLPGLEEQGITSAKLAAAARQFAEVRRAQDHAMAFVASECIELSGAGHAWLRLEMFRRCPDEMATRLLSRLIRTLGGIAPAPRTAELSRLALHLKEPGFAGATLGGCELIPLVRKDSLSRVLVVREPSGVEDDIALTANMPAHWDRRYLARVHNDSLTQRGTLHIGALGKHGVQALAQAGCRLPSLPKKALYGLATVRHLDEILCVPHINCKPEVLQAGGVDVAFVPRQSFLGEAFVPV